MDSTADGRTGERTGGQPGGRLCTMTTPEGTRIAYRDESPTPPAPRAASPFLLIHGLAGHMGEWDDLTSCLLAAGHRVIRYDAAAHGHSTPTPSDMTRESAARDASTLLGELGVARAILVGQSMGGLTALMTAATSPDLVEALILIEAGPEKAPPTLPASIATWLTHNPSPHHPSIPPPSRLMMTEAAKSLTLGDRWEEWGRVRCPVLVVRGESGTMPKTETKQMLTRRPTRTYLTTVPGAGHDVHLDRPAELYEAIVRFVGGPASDG